MTRTYTDEVDHLETEDAELLDEMGDIATKHGIAITEITIGDFDYA